jgi:hypothetical protein
LKGVHVISRKSSRRNDPEYWLEKLPPHVRAAVSELGADIENDDISVEEWTERGFELSHMVKKYPKAMQDAFHNAVRVLAAREREERRSRGEDVPDAPKY